MDLSEILGVPQRPNNARLRFQLKWLTNLGIMLVVFLPLAFVFSLYPWAWLADFAMIGLLYYIYAAVLERRAIGMYCNHCGGYIASNTPWVCAYCNNPNRNANEYPFVDKCGECGDQPKAYYCHHEKCRESKKIIFFTPDLDTTNVAHCLNSPELTKRRVKLTEDEERIQDQRHELVMAELEAKLKEVRDRIAGPKIKSRLERKMESAEDLYAEGMGMNEYLVKKEALVREMFKDDEKKLARALKILKHIENDLP